jgi:hypothetical protein
MAARSIAERWFARTAESYPSLTAQFLVAEEDRFRNPVGHALRENLAVLAGQLLGEMDAEKIAAALDGVLRIRAVQDFTPSQAVGFVFLLKPIVGELAPAEEVSVLEARIDQLALAAFDKYMQCREQLGELRVSEAKRAIRYLAGF